MPANARDTSSILLTHWDPGFYEPNADPICVAELALSALLYERVVIRAVDVIMNPFIARRLHTNEGFSTFRELIDHDCVTILTTRPDDYSCENIQEAARRSPIRARAMDQFLNRSHGAEPWLPEEWQWDLCDALDAVVAKSSDHPSLCFAHRPPEENVFAARFAEILRDRQKYDLAQMPQFADIEDRIAEEFILFCTEPGYFRRFLGNDPKASKREGFFRREAYQCAGKFPNPTGIMNLAQSVYMGLECEREDVEGRFGRKLWEPPFRFSSAQQKAGAVEQGQRIQIAPRRRSIPLALQPGLGRALALTRESDEFRRLQEHFRAWNACSPSDGTDQMLGAVIEKFKESAARVMVAYGPVERSVMILVKLLYFAARCSGYSFFVSLSKTINPDPIVDDLASNHLARLAGEMAHIVRSGVFARKVDHQIRRALTVRSGAIQFSVPEVDSEHDNRR
jgi:hypothetical protein